MISLHFPLQHLRKFCFVYFSTLIFVLIFLYHEQPCKILHLPAFVVPATRNEIGSILEEFKFQRGAEVGVQAGIFSEIILHAWPSCQKWYLVDAWRKLDNYADSANVDDIEQEKVYREAFARLSPWKLKTEFLRMLTSEAAQLIPNESLDFVYIDAAHDFCSVAEDIRLYWPKIRPGGILSGHDYYTAADVVESGQDWSLCHNGSRHAGAVKGAVDEFVRKYRLQLSITYRHPNDRTWMVRKSSEILNE